MTVASRVPGPESQSPRPPRASPTTARSAPREPGDLHLTMVLRTGPPPNGAVEGLPHATSGRGRRGPEVRAVPALSRRLLPFGVFGLLLIVSVYPARVLVVQL